MTSPKAFIGPLAKGKGRRTFSLKSLCNLSKGCFPYRLHFIRPSDPISRHQRSRFGYSSSQESAILSLLTIMWNNLFRFLSFFSTSSNSVVFSSPPGR
ncbi:hypothetical protein EUGRSUZ_H03211 [Eucalyptus grandis]|uniref:Uncharacterized protein n=2 Tax=Eucalyptus grandis TaxID=71139 RepID=A0ACC3K417_EUCGR|nr:hypothetical protein EUGRSUZ_H03211 [Eucalyptus grandis]